jgi:Tfp pilus assembly protein PilP
MLQSQRRIKKGNNPGRAIGVVLTLGALCLGAGVAAAANPGVLRPSEVPAAAPKAVQTPPDRFHYVPAGKADPFRPFLERDEALRRKMTKAKPVPVSPLQRAAVDQFKLVGIAGDAARRFAVLEDTGGKFYTIKPGTAIGPDGGRVAEILGDRVIIETQPTEPKKQTKVNRVVIKLRREE